VRLQAIGGVTARARARGGPGRAPGFVSEPRDRHARWRIRV